ncbi:MAG: hypothetical protein E7294_01930 [Lachnospiraceae bacterium]|jgi:hypothetical protein|nr:hypothetical protein [Lachnospiraceae bacterium]
MKRIVEYICFGLIGGIVILISIYFLIGALNGMQDVVAVTGKIKVVTPAKDDVLGLTDMGPVIFRETEMYQYHKEDIRVSKGGSTYYYQYAEKGFFNSPQGDFEAYESKSAARSLFGSTKDFKNPPFPKEFLNERGSGKVVICGTAEIGEDGIKLGKSLLRYLEGAEFTMEDMTVPAYNTPKDAGERFGLKLTEKGVYASEDSGQPKIGDLRVICKVVPQENLEGEFTAVGKLSDDNTLEENDDYGALYKGVVTLEEANRNYKKDQFKTGILFLALGLGIYAIGFLVIKVFN